MRRRVLNPLLGVLRQGLSPTQLALTVALGVAFGLIPVLGVTTLFSTFAAVRLRLNVAALLLISHLMSPLQLLLLIPLLQLGARVVGDGTDTELTLTQLQYLLSTDWMEAAQLLWRATLGGFLLWLLGSLVLVPGLFYGLRPVFDRMARRQAK
ncbi:conserved hypothetical protein [Hymenobacter roseosalivarius DSM 11622]|uniref:DUF2062 domain-containing protein n=2 Tax=Hymenobacter roseosalivarius TaxID=89967 RepID=A0A1W1W2H9_9BACT|nr:conserved hypothetical protein [Hymenobacter roseosalivarius DSM 11622]